MSTTERGRRTRTSLELGRLFGGAWVLLAGVAPACSDSSPERLRAAGLSSACTLNSHCAPGLACIFGRCHQPCDADVDCVAPARCVTGDGDTHVCQLPDETHCAKNEDCPTLQICAEDLRCRDLCRDDQQCVDGQRCTKTGVCVSPDRDHLDANGELVSGDAGEAGTGGATAGGASGGDAARAGRGGHGGTPSGVGGVGATGGDRPEGGRDDGPSGGTPSADAGEGGESVMTAGGGGSSGAGGDDGGDGPPPVESEPNDVRAEADPLPVGRDTTGRIEPSTDVDYFEFRSPAGPDGYFTCAVRDVSGTASAWVNSTVNDNLIWPGTAKTPGESLFGFFSAAADTPFQLAISLWAGTQNQTFGYTVRVDFHEVADAYEPNDTSFDAAEISVGVPIDAFMFAGLRASTASPDDFADWYAVETSATALHVTIGNVPTNLRLAARLYDANVVALGNGASSSNDAAEVEFTQELKASGRHLLKVEYAASMPSTQGTPVVPGEVPDHFTRPYRLTIN